MEYLSTEELDLIRLITDKPAESINLLSARAKMTEEQIKEVLKQNAQPATTPSNASVEVLKEHLKNKDFRSATDSFKSLYKGLPYNLAYFVLINHYISPATAYPCFKFLHIDCPPNDLPAKDLLGQYVKDILSKSHDNPAILDNLFKTARESLSVYDLVQIYSSVVQEQLERDSEINSAISKGQLSTAFSVLYDFIEKGFKVLSLIPEISPFEVKDYLNSTFRPTLRKLYESLHINDFVSFSNVFSQLCLMRDRIKVLLLTAITKVPHDQNDLLEFLVTDFAEVHEEKASECLRNMLKNEIGVFLQMLLAYLETYKFPTPDAYQDKHAALLYEIENGSKPGFKRPSKMSEFSVSKAFTQAGTSMEPKKGVRESYLKVYPAALPQKDQKFTKTSITSKTSFKTMAISYSFHNPPFLLHEKNIKFETPHRISFFTHKALQLFDSIFESVLGEAFPFAKLLVAFFETILWYVTTLGENISKSVNGVDSLVPYTKLLKFLSDVLMLRIRLSQYMEHLRYKGTMDKAGFELNFLFEESQLTCHNMQGELHRLVNKLIMTDIRQKILANIEEQKWLYHKEYLTSISWQITKNHAVPNIIKNNAFLKLEEDKEQRGELAIKKDKQDMILMTPTNGLLSLHNYLLDISDKFFIVGLIYESRSSLILLTRIIRQSAEEVFGTYFALSPSRSRNKQYAFDLNVFSLHLKAYMHHLFFVYLSSLLGKAYAASPDNLDYEFINEILSIAKIHRLAKTTSLVLAMDQLEVLNLLEEVATNSNFAPIGKSMSTAVYIQEKEKSPVNRKANTAFFSPLNPVSVNQRQVPILILKALYEYLVKYVFSKKWKAAADIVKVMLKEWQRRAYLAGGEGDLEPQQEDFDPDILKKPLAKEETRKLSEEIMKIIRKEKRLFFNKRALQIQYAIPIKSTNLQVPFTWEKMDSERIKHSLQTLSAVQVKAILLKRHEVCSDESLKLQSEEELVNKKILEVAAILDKK